MGEFVLEGLLADGPQNYLSGITDLEVYWHGGVAVLYSVSGPDGGVTCYQLQPNGSVQFMDQEAFASPLLRAAPGLLEEIALDTGPALVTLGWHGTALQCFDLGASGQIVGTNQLTVQGGLPAAMVEMESLSLGSVDLVFASLWGRAGMTVYQQGFGEQLFEIAQIGGGEATWQGVDLIAIKAVEVSGQTYVITASAFENTVTSYLLDPAGLPTEVASLGTADGLGIDTPSALVVVEMGGAQYLLLASASSSSLSVMKVEADGRLTLTDHVLDDLGTRFSEVAALEAITIGDRVYVVAGGGDDGLSLFTLLADGRLLHLAAITDNTQTALRNVTALELHDRGGVIDIFASSEAEAGITHLSFDPGVLSAALTGSAGHDTLTGDAGADMISGGAGNDSLVGADGDDILRDGVGADTLQGGAGADIFVLTADGEIDTIVDFKLGEDRLDISAFGRFYTVSALSISATATGATIIVNDEEIHLISADFMPLEAADFAIGDLFDMAHFPDLPDEPSPPGPPEIHGGSGSDVLTAGPESSVLFGNAGDDVLTGGTGSDTLVGGSGSDTLNGGAGSDFAGYEDATQGIGVRLNDGVVWAGAAGDVLIDIENIEGSDHGDTLVGGDGSNILRGGGGADVIYALGGADTLEGGSGNDTLFGQSGTNFLHGGEGDDSVVGGSGPDTVEGGEGDDILIGLAGADSLNGGAGADTLIGGNGPDTLNGGAGADTVDYAGSVNSAGVRLDGIPGWAIAAGDVMISIENVIGSDHNDIFVGSSGGNLLQGFLGNDKMFALDGADTLEGGLGNDTLYGQDGDDLLIGGSGADYLHGGRGTDTVSYGDAVGGVGARLDGGANWGQAAGNTILAVENLLGSAHNDTFVGSDRSNRIEAGGGNDSVYALAGNDWLDGGAGDDRLYGQEGDDTLIGGAGTDTLDGGAGIDTVSYAGATGGVGARLDGGVNWGQAAGERILNSEHLIGTIYNDTLVGSNEANRVTGGAGNDTLYGLSGDDTLDAGAGDDMLYGQGGADVFVFADGFGQDVIMDFASGAGGDRINLSALGAITDYADLLANHITQDGADLRIDDGAGNTVLLISTALAALDEDSFMF